MRTLPTGLLLATALLVTALPVTGADPSPTSTAIKFGMDSAGVSAQTAAGVAPDYGTFWIGPWTLTSGWGGPDGQLTAMKNAGVTPAIHFYYWGDDISPSCVENGCWSSLHNAQKTRQGWETLGTQMTDHLNAKMGGAPVVIFLESEFNKGGIETYEPFDGYMAAMADKIHAAYPNAVVVLGFGNWGSNNWGTFDRTATESDMVGIQGMRGSTKQSQTDMYTLYDGLLAGVTTLETKFPGKAIMLTDIAVSSYPEPSYVTVQSGVLDEVFDNLAVLKSHGVEAMIYRSWKDSPNMNTANYYGEAERHWGMAWAANGTQKSAGQVWVDGVKAERSASANHAPVAAFAAFAIGLTVTVDGSASSDVDGDALTYSWRFGDGATGTGPTATHAYASAGTYTVSLTVSDGALESTVTSAVAATQPNRAPVAAFTATVSQLTASVDAAGSSDADGDALSYAWTFGDGTAGSGKTATHAYAAAGTYTVGLTVSDGKDSATANKSVTTVKPVSSTTTTTAAAKTFTATETPKGNDWWVETKVSANQGVSKVEAKAGSGAWTVLSKQDWGAYAKSFNVPKGTMVQFRITALDGQSATTPGQAWLVDMSSKTATATSSSTTTTTSATTTTTAAIKTTSTTTTTTASTSTTASFKASFTPKSVGNDWWVESAVSGNQPVSKVEAKVNGGSWVVLSKQDWGNYAKSINAPDGAKVTFRATSTTGAQYSSVAYTWT